MKNDKLFSSENYRFYSREKLLYIAWACYRNENRNICFNVLRKLFKISEFILIIHVIDFITCILSLLTHFLSDKT